MRLVCTMALLLGASCVRDNPRYFDGQSSTGVADETTGVASTPEGTTRGGQDGEGSNTTATATSASELSSSSGGRLSPHCEGDAVLEEPFDVLPTTNDEWWVSMPKSILVTDTQGALSVAFDHSAGYWVMGSTTTLPRRGSLGFEVVKAPQPQHPIQVLVSLNDGELLLQFALALGSLDISWWDQQQGQATSATKSGAIEFDPERHRWLRLSFDREAREARAAMSADGVEWTTAFSADISSLALDQTQVQFSVGAWEQVPGVDSAVIDNAFMCIE